MKEGSHFDLGVAIGLLVAMQIMPQEETSSYLILGELALDGKIIKVKGILPAAIKASSLDFGLICPKANGGEALWSGNPSILAADNLMSIIQHFRGDSIMMPPKQELQLDDFKYLDLKDVKGQKAAKRAISSSMTFKLEDSFVACMPSSAKK